MNECIDENNKKIKFYYIKEDKIIVNYFDSNKKDVFLYNKDIELAIINRIEKDLLEEKRYISKCKYKIKQSFVWSLFFGLFTFSAASSIVKITNNIFMWFSLSVTFFVSFLNGLDVIREIKNVKNFNKMSIHIKNRKDILIKNKCNNKTKQNNARCDYSNNCIMSNDKSSAKKLVLKK